MVALDIVAAHLDYYNSLLHGTSSDNLRKLQVTQNALARIVFQATRTCSDATELRHQLHCSEAGYDYKLAVLTYKARQSGSPSYLASFISDYVPSRSLRSSDRLLLNRLYTSLIMADKAFSVSAPKIWNDLSFSITVVLQLVSIVLNTILNANSFTPHTLITPSNSRLPRLRFRFSAWTDRRITNWFCICIVLYRAYSPIHLWHSSMCTADGRLAD